MKKCGPMYKRGSIRAGLIKVAAGTGRPQKLIVLLFSIIASQLNVLKLTSESNKHEETMRLPYREPNIYYNKYIISFPAFYTCDSHVFSPPFPTISFA